MGIKRVITSTILSLLMFTAAQSQEVKTDSVSGELNTRNEQADSLKALTSELAQIKSRLDNVEQEQLYEKVWKRKKYWKLGIGAPNIERTDGQPMTWDSEFSFFIQRGRTIYFHSKPLWGMVKIGLDYGFMDLSYTKLKLKTGGPLTSATSTQETTSMADPDDGFAPIVSDEPSGSLGSFLDIDLGMHKIDYGLHVGPSVSVNPWNHLIVTAYFHVMPTASVIVENDAFSFAGGCAMSAGVSVSYKALSVGVEGVWSNLKYKQASFDDDDEDGDSEESENLFQTKSFKLKQKGPRFYIAFRF